MSDAEVTIPDSTRQYPSEFVAAVKQMLPLDGSATSQSIHAALDNGSIIVGRYLDDSSSGGIPPQMVIECLEGGLDHVIELRTLAKRLVRIRELYSTWGDIVDGWGQMAAEA